MKKLRVLVVDDSATVRQTLKEIIDADPRLSVMATASDPYVAVERIKHEMPDVITLDIEMPRMDGLTFLERVMAQCPIPVVICSSLTKTGSDSALAALDKGAVDLITKPKLGTRQFLEESRILICDTLVSASQVRRPARSAAAAPMVIEPKRSADVILPPRRSRDAMLQTTDKVVLIGASTGGTEALRLLLEELPVETPGVVIVQHMPEKFTASFAERLNQLCRVSVKEACDGDSVLPGHVLIAPGNHHTLLKRSGARYYVEVKDGPLVSRHRPSVDVLFRSAARYAGANAIGVILTGMGDDGAHGLLEMKQAGANTIAQDEATSVVFGMPAEAIKLGGVDQILPLSDIADAILLNAHKTHR
jgi:two-component system, chemotaxis family, protein-glutamate methylesterase/glutaminase